MSDISGTFFKHFLKEHDENTTHFQHLLFIPNHLILSEELVSKENKDKILKKNSHFLNINFAFQVRCTLGRGPRLGQQLGEITSCICKYTEGTLMPTRIHCSST